MQMTLPDVARVFDVSENTVIRWVEEENLPAEEVDSQFRFDRSELLEWATIRKRKLSPEIFWKVNGDGIADVSLSEALETGGVAYRVLGRDKRAVLRSIVEGLPAPDSFDRDMLLQLFLAREALGTTAIGNGLAIPHPRHPVVLAVPKPAVRLCFFAKALEFQAPDGIPVDTVFAMVCPTVHQHLQLLARLATVVWDSGFEKLLRDRAPADQIISEVRRLEASYQTQLAGEGA